MANDLIALALLICGCLAAMWLGRSIGQGIAKERRFAEIDKTHG